MSDFAGNLPAMFFTEEFTGKLLQGRKLGTERRKSRGKSEKREQKEERYGDGGKRERVSRWEI